MPDAPTAVIPIRSFAGMSRLAGVLPAARRIDLSRALAERVADAIAEAGCEMLVVTSDDDVRRFDGDTWELVDADESLPAAEVHQWNDTDEERQEYHSNSWSMIARLAPGASLAQAQAQIDARINAIITSFTVNVARAKSAHIEKSACCATAGPTSSAPGGTRACSWATRG